MVGFQALVLALASSTDNFMVGISVGLDLMKNDNKDLQNDCDDNYGGNGNDAAVDATYNDQNEVISISATTRRRGRQPQEQQQPQPKSRARSNQEQIQLQKTPTTKKSSATPVPLPTAGMLVVGNCIISTSNAFGAYLAAIGGSHMITSMINMLTQQLLLPTPPKDDEIEGNDNGQGYDSDGAEKQVASLLSSIAFGFLAFQEVKSARNQQTNGKDDEDQQKQRHMHKDEERNSSSRYHIIVRAFQLAVPMTLNNLAGGVTGGAVGITPSQSFVYGWIVSFVTMAVGYWIGSRYYQQQQLATDPSRISAILFGILSILAFVDTIS